MVMCSYRQDIDRYTYQIAPYIPDAEAGLSRSEVDELVALEASNHIPPLAL
jgi:hypothetical protein